ncbi:MULTISPECIES: serine hydrolase [unclassified Ruegeria]|uniref:serine hydrolase domain-containing protein n=1 Tax=unclassified Ruegeria TaxID=2625375 RepID=UPI0014879298|nr:MULTISPECIES: serine hydrolase domain-containing protein [unclassified Ruegeria]
MGFDPQRLQLIRDWMQRYVDERKYAGCALLLNRFGTEGFFHSCGQRSVEKDLPFQRDTIARIYSMTKPVTSVALMQILERGILHLSAPVSEFLPEFKDMQALIPDARSIDQTEPANTPTLAQLLTHTSGLSYPFNPGILPAAMDEQNLNFAPDQGPLSKRIHDLAQLPLAFQPGTRWEYSVGIDAIGRVIEVVSGQSLDRYFATHVFDPLGMSETGFSVPAGAGDRFASLYTPLDGDAMDLNAAQKGSDTLRLVDRPGDSPFEAATTFSGGGGLVGTIDDYSRFAEMLRCPNSDVLSARIKNFMMRNHLPGDIASMGPRSFAEQPMEGMGFGIGGAVVLDPGRLQVPAAIGDFSWGGMASTFFWVDRANDMTAVFFTQLSPSSSYPSRAQLRALVQVALVD